MVVVQRGPVAESAGWYGSETRDGLPEGGADSICDLDIEVEAFLDGADHAAEAVVVGGDWRLCRGARTVRKDCDLGLFGAGRFVNSA